MKKQSFSANKLKMTALAVSMLAVSQASWAATYYNIGSTGSFTDTTKWSAAACGGAAVSTTTVINPTADTFVLCNGVTFTLGANTTIAGLELTGAAPVLALSDKILTVTGDTKISTTATTAVSGTTGKISTNTLTINAAVPNNYINLLSVVKDLNLNGGSSLTVGAANFTVPNTIYVLGNSTLTGAGTVAAPINFITNNLSVASTATLTLKGGAGGAKTLVVNKDIYAAGTATIAADATTAGAIALADDNHILGTTGATLVVTAPFSIPAPTDVGAVVATTRFININGIVDLKGVAAGTNIITIPTANTKGFGFIFGTGAELRLPSTTAGTLATNQFTTGTNIAFCDLYDYTNTSIKTGSPETALTIAAPATLQTLFCAAPTKTAPYVAPVYINGEKAKTFAETK